LQLGFGVNKCTWLIVTLTAWESTVHTSWISGFHTVLSHTLRERCSSMISPWSSSAQCICRLAAVSQDIDAHGVQPYSHADDFSMYLWMDSVTITCLVFILWKKGSFFTYFAQTRDCRNVLCSRPIHCSPTAPNRVTWFVWPNCLSCTTTWFVFKCAFTSRNVYVAHMWLKLLYSVFCKWVALCME